MSDLDETALEAAQVAAREGCGLTIGGKHVFCDDPAIGDDKDGYGHPLKHSYCECKDSAERIVRAYLNALPQTAALKPPSTMEDGWVEWGGGDTCPIPRGALFHFRMADGEVAGPVEATALDWRHVRSTGGLEPWCIIAYRIVRQNPRTEGDGE